MAGHRTPGVAGIDSISPDAAYDAARQSRAVRPGPVGASDILHARRAATVAQGSHWFMVNVEPIEAQGRLQRQPPVMVRLAPRTETDNGFQRMTFPTHAAAAAAIARFVPEPDRMRALRGARGPNPADWLASSVLAGEIKVLWRPMERIVVSEREKAAPASRAAPAPVWTPPATIKAPEYSTFPPELDAAAMAQTLIEAARDGLPFCEECRNADERQQAGSP